MDIDEWELLPNEGFLEIHDKKIYSRKYPNASNTIIHANYFICPSNSESIPQPHVHDQILPLSVHLLEPKSSSPPPPENIKACGGTERDPISQVFFKKMKENEFVDMKLDSPKSSSSIPSRVFAGTAGVIQFQEKGKEAVPSELVIDGNNDIEGGLNIWKLSLTGIGAICSFGLVVATVCGIIVFSSGNGNSCKRNQQNQKLQLQIYTNDKLMNQGINHAKKLSEAISSMKGVPISKARITFGGRYNEAIELQQEGRYVLGCAD